MTRQTTSSASARPRRQPLEVRNKLKLKNLEDGYSYRIVNDAVAGRVADLLDQGYEVVPNKDVVRDGDRRVDGASALGSVSNIPLGRGDNGVVMRIKNEWKAEDDAAKAARADALDQGMKDSAKQGSDYGNFSLTVKR
jgi:hypothetical protein